MLPRRRGSVQAIFVVGWTSVVARPLRLSAAIKDVLYGGGAERESLLAETRVRLK